MQGRNRFLEIFESQIGERRIVGIVKCLINETEEEVLKFYLKNEDRVFFDQKHQQIKLTFDISLDRIRKGVQHLKAKVFQKVNFSIVSKNLFTLFISKIRKMEFLKLNLVEFDSFDSFNDNFVIERR